jgi:hypothetical protein
MSTTNTLEGVMPATVDAVVQRVAMRRQLSEDEARSAAGQLMIFLDLCATSDAPLAPSQIVDELWHEFILHTREYGRFCETVLGRFVHHVPAVQPDPVTYTRTLKRINEKYGPPDRRFWPRESSCSSCGSDCSS